MSFRFAHDADPPTRELASENAAAYLHETGRVPAGQSIRVRELSGGVSNVVLRVDLEDRPCFVIKQCRERLRVGMDWRAAGPDLDGQRCARRSTAVCGFDPPVLGRLPGADRNGPVVTGGGLAPRAIDHAAACVLARVDGKSPVEYLDPAGQELARRLALECSRPSTTWLRIEEMLGSAG
ncbi:MAG: hypothetical protein ACXU95_13070 [Isosphaeraceae bacterium]